MTDLRVAIATVRNNAVWFQETGSYVYRLTSYIIIII